MNATAKQPPTATPATATPDAAPRGTDGAPAGSTSGPMEVHRYRVRAVTIETPDVSTIEIEPHDAPVPPGRPGQFHMCWVYGVGEVPISISGLPDGRHRLHHTTRAVGPVTAALHDLAPGAMLGIRGPFGTGWEIESATGRDVLVIAGGLGLAPLHSAIERIRDLRTAFGRVEILVGTRTPETMPFAGDLHGWAQDAGLVVRRAVEDGGAHGWDGPVGPVTDLLSTVGVDLDRTTAFACGPEPMMRAAAEHLVARGVPADAIRVSLERNMHCGVGWCGHCQLGGRLLCRDGPVVTYADVAADLEVPER